MPRLQTLVPHVIPEDVMNKLRNHSIFTVEEFMQLTVSELTKLEEQNEKRISQIRRNILNKYAARINSVAEIYENKKRTAIRINTGSYHVDTFLLLDGIESSQITEIVGPSTSGKTQMCLSSCLSVVTSQTLATALYIDTQSSFSEQRFAKMYDAKKQASGEEMVSLVESLNRIRVAEVFEATDLLRLLVNVAKEIQSDTTVFYGSLRLIVIDSIALLFNKLITTQRPNDNEPRLGETLMDEIVRLLRSIATQYNIAILITNNVVVDSLNQNRNAIKPALGIYFKSVPSTQIAITHKPSEHARVEAAENDPEDSVRVAKLTKSTIRRTPRHCYFIITDAGIETDQINNDHTTSDMYV